MAFTLINKYYNYLILLFLPLNIVAQEQFEFSGKIIKKYSDSSFIVSDTIKQSLPKIKNIIDKEILVWLNSGYPYIKINPIIKKGRLILDIKKGKKALNPKIKILSTRPISKNLINKSLRFEKSKLFSLSKLDKSIELLKKEEYIDECYFESPIIKDSITIIPLNIKPRERLNIDGSIGWQNQPYNSFIGKLKLEDINLFGKGEIFSVSLNSYDSSIHSNSYLKIPYIFNTDFSTILSSELEIAKEKYGFGKIIPEIEYNIGDSWRVGLRGIFSEYSSNEIDTIDSYRAIGIKINRIPVLFNKGVKDWALDSQIESNSIYSNNSKFKGEFQLSTHYSFNKFALYSKSKISGIVTKENLKDIELYYLGGHKNLRGYQERAIPSIKHSILANEIRYYSAKNSYLYLFTDGAISSKNSDFWKNKKFYLGYGIGITVPKNGVLFSLEWARNRDDGLGLGRIHFSFSSKSY